jgi:UDP-N-acetylmuramate dehydrogenase
MTKLQKGVLLKNFSNYRIGGQALYFLDAKTDSDLVDGIKEWQTVSSNLPENERKIFVLGGGTNILFSDDGFKGLVIRNCLDSITQDFEKITAGAGTLISKLTDFCIENSLSGLEWAGGLPGTVGGAIRGNAGAFGGETKDNIESVVSLNLTNFAIVKRNNGECEFSYRSSIFKTKATDEIIISASVNLKKGDKEEIRKQTVEKMEFRKTKHPLENPNAGSVFKNVPFENVPQEFKNELSQYIKNDPIQVVPSAKIIFLAGLKGKRVGDAAVSDKHTNFIINLDNATAKDVLDLIEIIKNEVKQKYGIMLEEEIMRVA